MDIAQELRQIRKDILLAAYAGGAAHLASALSMVEIMYALYFGGILRYRVDAPDWADRDRLIVSKGHGSLALYAALCKAGFFDRDELMHFCKPHARLGGEPCLGEVPGVEATTGSLGHGLPFGVGVALATKTDYPNVHTYVILGDGECEEGSVWEAVMTAAKYRLHNLTVIMDCNRIQKMGFIEDILDISEWRTRWEAFGWSVCEADGHDVQRLICAISARNPTDGPKLVIAHTIKGKGLSFMENDPKWHWRMPNKKELRKIMEELDITQEELVKCKELT